MLEGLGPGALLFPESDSMAESELSVLNRQCLNRYIPGKETLARETAAWTMSRNSKGDPVQRRSWFRLSRMRSRNSGVISVTPSSLAASRAARMTRVKKTRGTLTRRA